MIRQLIKAFFSIPTAWAVAGIILVAGFETALFFGFILPGESAVFLGGVLASRGRVPLAWILIGSVVGPMLGDAVGYVLGRRYGEDIVRRRLGKKWNRAHRWLSKNSGWAIFAGRFIPFVRTVLPGMAGATEVPRMRFFAADFSAAGVWGVGTALAGYFAGREYLEVLRWFSGAGYVLLAAALVGGGIFWLVRTRRHRRRKR